MRSAGAVFFWRCRLLFRDRIALALHKQVDLGSVVHIGDEVHGAVLGPLVFEDREQHILFGKGAKLFQVALFDPKQRGGPPGPIQLGHAGQSGYFLPVLGQGPEERRQVFAPCRQQFDAGFCDLDALLYHQVSHFAAGVHIHFTSPVFRYSITSRMLQCLAFWVYRLTVRRICRSRWGGDSSENAPTFWAAVG